MGPRAGRARGPGAAVRESDDARRDRNQTPITASGSRPQKPPQQAQELDDALVSAGVPHQLTLVEGAGHGRLGLTPDQINQIAQATVAWLTAQYASPRGEREKRDLCVMDNCGISPRLVDHQDERRAALA